MTTEIPKEIPKGTAIIYQFPTARMRMSAGAQRDEQTAHPSPRAPETVMGGAWYHDAAIQESKQESKRVREC